MRGRAPERILPFVCLLTAAGCLDGVYRDPVGHLGGQRRQTTLSGSWEPCGLLGSAGPMNAAVSADGGTGAVLFANGAIALHHLPDGVLLSRFQGSIPAQNPDNPPPSPTHDVALSDDGAVVALADGRHVVGWRAADGTGLFDVPGLYNQVKLSPRGDRFLAWQDASDPLFRVELRSAAGGDLLQTSDAGAVGFSADGTEVVTWREGMLAAVSAYGAATPIRQAPLAGSLTDATISPDGRYLAGFTDAGSILHLYGTADASELWNQPVNPGRIAFSADASRLMIFEARGLFMLDVASRNGTLHPLDAVRDAALGPGGAPLLVADVSGLYIGYDFAAPLSPLATIAGQGLPIKALAVSPDGRWLAAGSDLRLVPDPPVSPIRLHPEDVLLWDLSTSTLARTFPGVAAVSLQFSADSRRLLIANRHDEPEGRLEEWDLDGPAPARSMKIDGRVLAAVAYSPDESWIAASFGDGVGLLAKGSNDVTVGIPQIVPFPAAAFSADSKWLATSGVGLWRTGDWMKAWTTASAPLPPVEPVDHDNSIAFSPDGTMIVSFEGEYWFAGPVLATTMKTKLYASQDGSLLHDFGAQFTQTPTFSPDSAWLLWGDLAWEISTGRSISLHIDAPAWTTVSTFFADGRVALAREDGVVELHCPK
jgi:WD40 repeat protein